MDEDIERKLYESYSEERIGKKERQYDSSYFWIYDHLKDDLPKEKDSKILVAGCGMGHEVYALNKLGYNNVLGVDFSQKRVEIARKKGLNCIKEDIFSFLEESTNNSFKTILAFNFLEHFSLEDAIKLCRLFFDKLGINGSLFLKVPNRSNLISSHYAFSDLTHKQQYTPISVKQLLKLCGFKYVETRNLKPFGMKDSNILRKMQKIIAVVLIKISRFLIRTLYWLHGTAPPDVISQDLLAIGRKIR